jgi:hypothetical protein
MVRISDDDDEDSEVTTSTSDSGDDSDSPAPPPRAAAGGARPADDDDDDETDEEHTEEEAEEEEDSGSASSGSERRGAVSPASARSDRPATPGDVSAELVELALEVVEGDDVSPVVRLAFERAAPQARALRRRENAPPQPDTPARRRARRAARPLSMRWRSLSTARWARRRTLWRSTTKSSSRPWASCATCRRGRRRARGRAGVARGAEAARRAQEDAEDLTASVRAHNEQLQGAGAPLLGACARGGGLRRRAPGSG